jgi:hypothetical protein
VIGKIFQALPTQIDTTVALIYRIEEVNFATCMKKVDGVSTPKP